MICKTLVYPALPLGLLCKYDSECYISLDSVLFQRDEELLRALEFCEEREGERRNLIISCSIFFFRFLPSDNRLPLFCG